jgi:hypothetical protein
MEVGMASMKTAIVTGRAAVVRAFLDRGYNVVRNARSFSSESFTPSPNLTLVNADAVVYLTEARQITGEVLHVDGGAHAGRWQPAEAGSWHCPR